MKFRYKTIIGIASIEFVLLAIIIVTVLNNLKQTNQTQINERIYSLSNLYVASINDALLSYDQATVLDISEKMIENNSVAYIKIFNIDQQPILELGDSTNLNKPFMADLELSRVTDGVYDFESDILAGIQPFGSTQLGFNVQTLQQSILNTQKNLLIFAGIEIMLVALFSYILGCYLTSQLTHLNRASIAIANDDYSVEINTTSKDEIGELTNTYNHMRAQLLQIKHQRDDYEHSLKTINAELEDRVNRRTQALQKTNDELKKAQKQLVEQEKLASIGLLSSGVAHEINTPLSSVTANLSSMQKYTEHLCQHINPKDKKSIFIFSDLPELIKDCQSALIQIGQIVKGLQTFSSSQTQTQLHPINIQENIDNAFVLMKSALPNHIHFDFQISKDITIMGNDSKFIQLLTNLIINSCDAINELENHINSKSGLIKISALEEKNYVLFEIEDNGNGMDELTLNRLFDPFFTTKPIGKGTGLGLSIVYGIIEEFNGNICVASKPASGTKFTIRFLNNENSTLETEKNNEQN